MKKTSKTNRLISLVTALVTVFTFVVFVLPNGTVKASAASYPNVEVKAHVQNIGWMDPVTNGEMAGTEGQSLRMECLTITVTNASGYDGNIYMNAHLANIGWVGTRSDYSPSWSDTIGPITAGTVNEERAIEAVSIWMDGSIAEKYDIRYKVHVQNNGWTDWQYNGQVAGTTGQALRTEAIKVEIVPKGYRVDTPFYGTLIYRLLSGNR